MTIDHLVEVLLAERLRDQPAQLVFRRVDPARQFHHFQLGLAVDLQHLEMVAQDLRETHLFLARGPATRGAAFDSTGSATERGHDTAAHDA